LSPDLQNEAIVYGKLCTVEEYKRERDEQNRRKPENGEGN
jgi:hypothetical protein